MHLYCAFANNDVELIRVDDAELSLNKAPEGWAFKLERQPGAVFLCVPPGTHGTNSIYRISRNSDRVGLRDSIVKVHFKLAGEAGRDQVILALGVKQYDATLDELRISYLICYISNALPRIIAAPSNSFVLGSKTKKLCAHTVSARADVGELRVRRRVLYSVFSRPGVWLYWL